MNVIFLTLADSTNNIQQHSIYNDLLREFRDEGHNVYVVTPFERRTSKKTAFYFSNGINILGVRVLNIQKSGIIERGLGTVLLEKKYINAIKKYLKTISFDLILYSTPPITLVGAVEYLKATNPKAKSYLLLKDIFPQNAVDLGMMSQTSWVHKIFRNKEIRLYKASDYIGCMSPANVDFVIKHNDFIDPLTVEVAPNSIKLRKFPQITSSDINKYQTKQRNALREKYQLPLDKPIFIYGGNLGKPQGIPFLIECLEANKTRSDCHFLVVGNGTEYGKLEQWVKNTNPQNMSLFVRLPKEDYDALVQSCDVGLIFIDYRFLIPNFPSRLLSYLEFKMPVVIATDPNTDMGRIAEANGFGKACMSNDVLAFTDIINYYVSNPDKIDDIGERGYKYLKENYTVENTYNIIINHFK